MCTPRRTVDCWGNDRRCVDASSCGLPYILARGSPERSQRTKITRRRAGLYPSHVDRGESRARGICLSVTICLCQQQSAHTSYTLLGLGPLAPLPSEGLLLVVFWARFASPLSAAGS